MQSNLKKLYFKTVFFSAALPLALSAALAPAPADAQQSVSLEEVIVTAQKREETLQEAPLAITAFTQQDLEDLGAVEFGTVANKAPNIILRKQSASHSNYAFGIRGVSAGETALAVDSVVGLYIDGVYLGRLTGSAFDISDTERVEVLRGPQGTLYGRNATAGAINIITNKPSEDFAFRNYLTAGERGLLRNQTTVNTGYFPFAGGMLSARLNFSKWEFDGLVENVATGQDVGDIDSDAGRLALRWDSGDGLLVDYNYSLSDKTGNSQLGQITRIDTFAGFLAGSAAAGKTIVGIGPEWLGTAEGQTFQAEAQTEVTAEVQAEAAAGTVEAADVATEIAARVGARIEARVGQEVGARVGPAFAAGGLILALGGKAAAGGALTTEEMTQLAAAQATLGAQTFAGEFGRVTGLVAALEPFPIYAQAQAASHQDRLGVLPVRRSQPETSEFEAHALTVEWEMPTGIMFKSITSYREWDSELPNFGNDFGTFVYAGPENEGAVVGADGESNCVANCVYRLDKEDGQVKLAAPGELLSLFTAQRRSSQEQFTQEFQFSGTLPLLDSQLDWVGGFYYFQEKADEVNPQRNTLPGPSLPFFAGLTTAQDRFMEGSYHGKGSGSMCGDPDLSEGVMTLALAGGAIGTFAEACLNAAVIGGGGGVFNYGTENEAYAFYWQGQYAVSELTNLTVGLRYTQDDKEGYLESVPVFSALITSPTKLVRDDDSWNKFTWDVSLDHQLTDEVNLYARAAAGYRAGGYNVRINIIENFGDPVEQENILSYELGAKTQWFDNRLRANLTLFYADYEDKQTSTFSPSLAGATSVISNFGEQTNQGAELEILALPVPGLTLGLNYGYTDVDIKEAGPGEDPDTQTPPYVPETTVYTWAQYEFAPSDYGTLSVRVDYDYADTFTISAAVPLEDPANRATERALWGARISLNDIPLGDADQGRLSLALWGRNLKNEEYREFVIPFGTFNTGAYGELRSIGMDIVYDY